MDVTVIIPTHNDGRRLGHAVSSALGLTDVREVLVVDDGSPTPAVVGDGPGVERVRTIRQANTGAGAARNRGMSEARSEWIVFLDADDVLLGGTLQALALAAQMRAAVALSGGFEISAAGQRIEKRPSAERHARLLEHPSDVFRHSGYICMSGVIMHRRVVDEGLRFDESMRACQDSDFLRRIADGAPIILTSFAVAERTLHPHKSGSNISSSGNIETRSANWIKLFDRWYDDRVREDWVYRLGYWTSAYAKYGRNPATFERLLQMALQVGHPVRAGLRARFAWRSVARTVGVKV